MMDKKTQTDAQIASLMASVSNLEVQMGQISQALNSRPKDALPSNMVAIALKNLVVETDKKVKELQDNIVAVNFTPQSKVGKMLMDIVRHILRKMKRSKPAMKEWFIKL